MVLRHRDRELLRFEWVEPQDAEITALRAKVAARAKADVDEYGRDGVRAIEMAYRAYSRSKDVDNEHLRMLIDWHGVDLKVLKR